MTRNRPLSKEEHVELRGLGILWEFYPECSGNWEEDKLLWGRGTDGDCNSAIGDLHDTD